MLSQQQLKYIRSLHLKKHRDESGIFIAEGIKIVEEAIRNQPHNIEQIILTSGFAEQIKGNPILTSVDKLIISEAEFNRITALKSPQGILALMKKQPERNPVLSEQTDLTLVLDRISDPGNFGTIIRLADWFGIKHIICSPETVECYNPKVVQASMGSLFRMNIYYSALDTVISSIKKKSAIHVYGTGLSGSNLYDTELLTPALIILGNEARGVSGLLEPFIDCSLLIPSFSKTSEKPESLNVSIAAAIVCSEFRRQNG